MYSNYCVNFVGGSTGDDTTHYYSTAEQGNIDKTLEVQYSLIGDDEYMQPVPHQLSGN